ncbi:NAD-dependent epimerase/dehydratase family protein [Bacillus cytotoxicus]|uniref:NAD-dependent epimerase/dehydratase family protein n=1 Tax=Bacillus cereus group sp. BfR-BA-01492 TaxID=2920361 RepID=UPI001F574206|nr:NAD-dependent epimerase/dehydratase family protein [Bacillus cereus group sp. BfR-BA-01492]EMA6343633.1 NAD-dependent epimerase/dehydratase family protein [Bacillus cytotoxicus]
MKKRCLITGGAGFIGSHLAEELVKRGHQVTIVDNFYKGKSKYHEELIEKIPIIPISILDKNSMYELVDQHDVVFHLAAILGVKTTMEKSIELIETNFDGTRNILQAALTGKKKVIFASTSEVYGKGTPPFSEDGDRLYGATSKIRWSYAICKTLEETLCLGYALQGLPVTIVRYFNIYGPRAKDGPYAGVIPRFIRAALQGDDLLVYGDGKQTRCFTYVSDAVEATISAMDENVNGEIINIGSEDEKSIQEVAQDIHQLTNSSSKIVHVPFEKVYPHGFEEIPNRKPDVTKLREICQFHPNVSWEQGLKETIQWFREIEND